MAVETPKGAGGGLERVTIGLDVPVPGPVAVDPAHTLLVLVDLQNEFCHPDGRNYLGPAAENACRSAAALVDRARAERWRVLWIRSEYDADAVEFTAFGREPRLVKGTWAVEYAEPLTAGPGEAVVLKHSRDCFARTELDGWLVTRGIVGPGWTVLVAGVALRTCVNHAVLGFSVRDYRVAVVLDCTAPHEGPDAAATLWRYGQRAYAYNVSVTRSELISTGSAAGAGDGAPG